MDFDAVITHDLKENGQYGNITFILFWKSNSFVHIVFIYIYIYRYTRFNYLIFMEI